jgi:hypothetical protein
VVDGLGAHQAGERPRAFPDDDALTIAVYVPAVLSIKPVAVPGEEGEA